MIITNKNYYNISFIKFIITTLLLLPIIASASVIDGTIIIPNQFAWGEKVGWVNFATQNGNVHITDDAITGFVWDPVYGWINLNPPTSGVKNDKHGNLSGFAWSTGMGFIDFTGVTIDATGIFHGQASGTSFGRLNFDCVSCIVATDYRPGGSLVPPGGGFFTQVYNLVGTPLPPLPPQNTQLPQNIIEEINKQNNEVVTTPIVTEKKPEPTEFQLLLAKFPSFKDILTKLNINVNKESDALNKLTNINFTLPTFLSNSLSFIKILGLNIPKFYTNLKNSLGLNNLPNGQNLQNGLITNSLSKNQSLQAGLSVSDIEKLKKLSLVDLPIEIKKGVPEEVLFTRAGNANIDIPINLKVDEKGKLNKSIELTSNKRVTLIIKPKQNKTVDSVVGYLVFKSKFSLKDIAPVSLKESTFPRFINTAHAEGISGLPKDIPEAQPEEMFVLMKFAFNDSNKDGLYVANINTPAVEGNYEIVTSIEYKGEKTPKVLRLVTVIDPEGYVYEAAGKNETRIRNATVTMLKFNEDKKNFENWNAKDFAQKNPQITNQTGQYSFLVPEGLYKITVEADGYESYSSAEFTASDGDSLHENIELTKKHFRFSDYLILLIPIFLW